MNDYIAMATILLIVAGVWWYNNRAWRRLANWMDADWRKKEDKR